MYSKQKLFCNACGIEINIELPLVVGKQWRCCSTPCLQEMLWREALSLLNKEYKPQPEDLLEFGAKMFNRKTGNEN